MPATPDRAPAQQPARPLAPAAPSPTGHRRELRYLGFALGLAFLVAAWTIPPQAGLTLPAQRALGLILFTVTWCAFGVVPEGLVAIFFTLIGIAGGLTPPRDMLWGWTDPVLWFNIAAFGVGYAFQSTGLGRRLALVILARIGGRYYLLVGMLFVVGALFSVSGLAAIARMAIFLSIIAGIGAAAGLKPDDRSYRGLVMAALAASTSTGLLLLAGAAVNPAAMTMAGTTVLYSRWLVLFGPVTAAIMLALALAIPLVWRPERPLTRGADVFKGELAQRGRLSPEERKVLAILGLALVLWNLDFWHGIDPAWIALLAAALMMMPGIGVMRFDDLTRATNWNVVFFMGAALSISRLVTVTGLKDWLADRLLNIPLPTGPVGFLAGLAILTVLLHIPLGTSVATMTIAIPAFAAYATRLGYQPEIIGYLVHALLWTQFFLPYQHVAALYAMGHPGFRQSDLYGYGLLSAVVVIGIILLVGIPYWSLIGALR